MKLYSDAWFQQPVIQTLVTLLANTKRGRERLCISNDVPAGRSVVSMHRDRYTWLTNQKWPGLLGARAQIAQAASRGEPISLTTDFRCRSTFADRLHELARRDALNPSLLGAYLRWREHGWPYMPGLTPRVAYAVTSPQTFYPDPHIEVTSGDARVGEVQAGGVSWATLIAAAGNTVNNNSTTMWGSYIAAHADADKWTTNYRAIIAFDTSPLGPSATVTEATLSVYGKSPWSDGLSISQDMNVFEATPADPTNIVAGDYAQTGGVSFSTAITVAGGDAADYNDFLLDANGRANVDTGGVSGFSVKNENYDADAVQPAHTASQVSRQTLIQSKQAGTSQDSKLEVAFTMGPAGYAALSGIGR